MELMLDVFQMNLAKCGRSSLMENFWNVPNTLCKTICWKGFAFEYEGLEKHIYFPY